MFYPSFNVMVLEFSAFFFDKVQINIVFALQVFFSKEQVIAFFLQKLRRILSIFIKTIIFVLAKDLLHY